MTTFSDYKVVKSEDGVAMMSDYKVVKSDDGAAVLKYRLRFDNFSDYKVVKSVEAASITSCASGDLTTF